MYFQVSIIVSQICFIVFFFNPGVNQSLWIIIGYDFF